MRRVACASMHRQKRPGPGPGKQARTHLLLLHAPRFSELAPQHFDHLPGRLKLCVIHHEPLPGTPRRRGHHRRIFRAIRRFDTAPDTMPLWGDGGWQHAPPAVARAGLAALRVMSLCGLAGIACWVGMMRVAGEQLRLERLNDALALEVEHLVLAVGALDLGLERLHHLRRWNKGSGSTACDSPLQVRCVMSDCKGWDAIREGYKT